ncbi:uncharacterized protein METZ01_LOCUS229037, partial [marine metagenome]
RSGSRHRGQDRRGQCGGLLVPDRRRAGRTSGPRRSGRRPRCREV